MCYKEKVTLLDAVKKVLVETCTEKSESTG